MMAAETETVELETEKRSVVVIDDEKGPRESLRFLLGKEFTPFCADCVDRGLQLVEEHHPEVIILDVRMPGKDGLDGLREIRRIDQTASIIMLTGYGSVETAQQALRLGATDYMNKPFDTEEMTRLVRLYAQRSVLERRRLKMLDELREVNQRLVTDIAEKDQLSSLLQSSAELVHDLRSPLMIVSGYVELLSEHITKARNAMGDEFQKTADYLEVIEQNVQRCCELSRMWQRLGRSVIPEMKPIRVSQVTDSLVAAVEPLAAARGVSIEYDLRAGDPKIKADPAQLVRAVANVINNALSAVLLGTGTVTVSSKKESGELSIEIRDDGCGMTPEVVEKAFDTYFTTKGEVGGTGLGLAITKKIIDDHFGTVDIASSPGKGTVVQIRLPLA